jgi:gluconolactonase
MLTHNKILLTCLVFASAIIVTNQQTAPAADEAPTTIGQVIRLDPALDQLIPADAKIEILATDLDWSEGPIWIKDGEYLLFSDIPKGLIYCWKEGEGIKEWLNPSGYTGETPRGGELGSNGLTLNAEGQLIICQHGDRRVVQLDAPLTAPEPKFITLADKYDDKRFNSPNDLAIHSSGVIYFTDPPYGMVKQFDDPNREMKYLGVFRRDLDGKVTLLTDQLSAPNGIAFSPDEKILYVAQSDPNAPIWMAFDVQDDGNITNGRVLMDGTELLKKSKGLPDGLKVDKQGNLFATGPGGVLVMTPEGKHLGTISTGELISNCGFGNDGQTLYMTSDMYLCRIRLSTTGVGF